MDRWNATQQTIRTTQRKKQNQKKVLTQSKKEMKKKKTKYQKRKKDEKCMSKTFSVNKLCSRPEEKLLKVHFISPFSSFRFPIHPFLRSFAQAALNQTLRYVYCWHVNVLLLSCLLFEIRPTYELKKKKNNTHKYELTELLHKLGENSTEGKTKKGKIKKN